MEETEKTTASTRTIGIKFGLISAVISIVMFLILVFSGANAFDNKWGWFGFVISIGLLIYAHKTFKDENNGFMSYGEGVGIGTFMTLMSMIVAGGFTFIYATMIDPTVMETFYDKQLEDMQAKGMSDEQAETAVTWTKKLFWVLYVIFGFIFGMIVNLLVSIFTQKKSPQERF